MSDTPRSPVRRFFSGMFSAVDFARRLTLNALFLLALLILVLILAADNGPMQIQDRTTLVIAPEGRLVEEYSGSAMSRAMDEMQGKDTSEVQLRDLLAVLEEAKADERIDRVVLKFDKLQIDGMASLRELGQALGELKEANKEMISYSENIDQKQYYLAATAHKVYLHPAGSVMLEGLGRYRQYFRQALQDKLGVNVQLFRVGEFKSAAEPFILDQASAESKQADLHWMNSLWATFLHDIGKMRGLDPRKLHQQANALPELVEAAGGDIALMAKRQGLVDDLLTADEVRAKLKEGWPETRDGITFRQVGMDEYLATRRLEKIEDKLAPSEQVRVIVAEGEIGEGEQNPGNIGGETTSALIAEAREDDQVKAVVLRVNSPGGTVFASELIRRQVELTREAGKPVVVSMGDMAASGGYWISMNANQIYADPSTVTGSIGIFGLVPDLSQALGKVGVRTDGVATNRHAGGLDITRPMDEGMKKLVQSSINHGYQQFIGKVAAARGMDKQAVDEAARGRVWSGAQALKLGLVDKMGGLREAAAAAAKLAKLEPGKYQLSYSEQELSGFERLLMNFSTTSGARIVEDKTGMMSLLAQPHVRQAAEHLQWLSAPKAGEPPVRVVAHCMCEL